MPKQRSYNAAKTKNRKNVIRINVRDIEKKIRKPHAPPAKVELSKKAYTRKKKHPKRAEE